jgi:NADH-quinone oxidoreductase subunit G
MKAKSGFAKTLKDAEKPMIIVGMGAFAREDGEAVHHLVREAAETFDMVKADWNGFNVLHDAAGRVGALDAGFYSKDGFDLGKMSVVYLLGADDFDTNQINKKAFVIYQGHHGDAGAHRADVILPGAAYTEKNALYVNTEGRVQQAKRAVYPPGDAREDWKILRALSGYMKKPLSYDDHLALRKRITEEWPHMGAYDTLTPAEWKKFGKKGKFLDGDFKSTIENFYITNCITRASRIMAECSESIYNARAAETEQMEAAE